MKKIAFYSLSLASILAIACSGGSAKQTSHGDVELIDRTKAAISLDSTDGTVNGSYGANCNDRAGSSWVLHVAGWQVGDLSVDVNDSDCVLTLESVSLNGHSYAASTGIALASGWAASAPKFTEGSNEFAFYGNAKMSDPSFSTTSFSIQLVLSDDANNGADNKAAQYLVSTSSYTQTNEHAPDYSLSLTTADDEFTIVSDANDQVLSVSGHANFTAGSYTGEEYMIRSDLGDAPSFAAVDGAWNANLAEHHAMASSVAAADFGLSSLPTTYTVIIKHQAQADAGSVTTYQTFRITFNQAPLPDGGAR